MLGDGREGHPSRREGQVREGFSEWKLFQFLLQDKSYFCREEGGVKVAGDSSGGRAYLAR